MGIQQIDPMRFSPYMYQCLQDLEAAKEVESDVYLIQLVRIQLLLEKIANLEGQNELFDRGPRGTPKDPNSGNLSDLEAEIDLLRTNIPQSLAENSTAQENT